MSYDAKVAYIWGIGNLAVFERAVTDASSAPHRSFLPWLLKGIQGKSISEVVSAIDIYYQTYPAQLNHPVMDGLFRAVVLPSLPTSPDERSSK
jgi:hypothetical protein